MIKSVALIQEIRKVYVELMFILHPRLSLSLKQIINDRFSRIIIKALANWMKLIVSVKICTIEDKA